jgi:hypothetical protein
MPGVFRRAEDHDDIGGTGFVEPRLPHYPVAGQRIVSNSGSQENAHNPLSPAARARLAL